MFRIEDLENNPLGETFILTEEFRNFVPGDEFKCQGEPEWEPLCDEERDYFAGIYEIGEDLFNMEYIDGSGPYDTKTAILINHIELKKLFKSQIEMRAIKIDNLLDN